nr:hypothetical protein pmam_475 [Pithovirus mammoth]
MQSLPTEIQQEVLFHLPPSKILEVNLLEEVASSCDWSFWARKAAKDFDVSREYFDLPLKSPSGVGSFQRIYPNSKLNQGVYRYVQIASRCAFLVECLYDGVSPYGLIERPNFFRKCHSANQFTHIDLLEEKTPPQELSACFASVSNLGNFISGKTTKMVFDPVNLTFELEMIRKILSPKLAEASTEKQGRSFHFLLEIQSGKISPELVEFLNREICRENAGEIEKIVGYLIICNVHFDLTREPLIRLLGFGCSKIHHLCQAIKGTNLEAFKLISELCEEKELADEIYRLRSAAYFSGSEEMLDRVEKFDTNPKEEQPITDFEDFVGDFIQGYRFHRKPERFLNFLRKTSDLLTRYSVLRICELGDSDIIDFIFHSSGVIERDPEWSETAFLQEIDLFVLGNIDVLDWMERTLNQMEIPSILKDQLRLSLSVTSNRDHDNLSRFQRIVQENVTFSKTFFATKKK